MTAATSEEIKTIVEDDLLDDEWTTFQYQMIADEECQQHELRTERHDFLCRWCEWSSWAKPKEKCYLQQIFTALNIPYKDTTKDALCYTLARYYTLSDRLSSEYIAKNPAVTTISFSNGRTLKVWPVNVPGCDFN